jgi:CRP-like cAMP-binding protein
MKLDDVVYVLKAVPIFRRVEAEALRVLVFSATRRQVRAGETLFRRGETSDGGFLVLEGEVILDATDDGSPSRHAFGPGALIGQTALFSTVERPATAIIRSAGSLLVFPRELMLRVMENYPQSAVAMREALAEEMKVLAGTLQRLSR